MGYVLNKEKQYYIYKYTSPSGKHYIGRSCNSQDIRARSDGSGYKNCAAFWRAILKYGWGNFQYEVLEENIGYESVDIRENYWINFYHSSTDENGYNLLKACGERKTYTQETIDKLSKSHIGQVAWNRGKINIYSDETLRKMSEAKRGKYRGLDSPNYGKPMREEVKEKLRQYRGEKSSSWGKKLSEETKKKISEKLKGHPALVGRPSPMRGKHLSEETKLKISVKLKGRFAGSKNPMYGVHLVPSDKTKKKLSEASSVPVMQFDLKGKYLKTFPSRKVAAEAVGGAEGLISACCCKRKKSHKGYQWRNIGDEQSIQIYKSNEKDNIPIVQMLDGEIINIFSSINEATRSLNKQGSNICKCLKGELKSCYGFQWKRLADIIPDFRRKEADKWLQQL